jgi:hypothetical protein
MTALYPGDTSSKDDLPERTPVGLFGYQLPVLDVGVQQSSYFQALEELEYRVLDTTGAEVIPPTSVEVDPEAVNTDVLLEYTQGLYAPSITVPATINYGTWTIEWTGVWHNPLTVQDVEFTATSTFVVVNPTHPIVSGYVQVQDMYDEGVPVLLYPPERVATILEKASNRIEQWTGRTFVPELKQLNLDGRGGPALQVGEPIIGISQAYFVLSYRAAQENAITDGTLQVYNRHIRQNLLEPDDRDDPKVEFRNYPGDDGYANYDGYTYNTYDEGWFANTQQNVLLQGVFGYTDWNGTIFGQTPTDIQDIVMRLAMKWLPGLWQQTGGGGGVGPAGPILSEKTMDQAVTFANLAGGSGGSGGSSAYSGNYTGDPAIDQVIETYRAPSRSYAV